MLEKINYNINCQDTITSYGIEEVKNLLTLTEENNYLYICHPRHVFETLEEDKATKIITSIDWNSLNMSLVSRFDDYGKFSIFDQYFKKNQFTYIQKRFDKMLKHYHMSGKDNFVFPLAIIEEVRGGVANKSTYIPRGIICAGQTGVLVCNKMTELNKVYQKNIK